MRLSGKRELDKYLGKEKPGYDIAKAIAGLFDLASYKHIKQTDLDLNTLKVEIDGDFVRVSIDVKRVKL